jgi:hypothetical protein
MSFDNHTIQEIRSPLQRKEEKVKIETRIDSAGLLNDVFYQTILDIFKLFLHLHYNKIWIFFSKTCRKSE